MIKKISIIKNLAVFKDFEWDTSVLNAEGQPIPFEKLNILYGRNYSGKTTLSRIFRAMEIGIISEKYETPMFTVSFEDGMNINHDQLSTHNKIIRVFNEDFIRDNLRFISNPDETIKSFAILGDDNNALEKEISDLESMVGSNEAGKETGLYALLNASLTVYKEMEAAHKQSASGLERQLSEKAIGRANGIKYKLDKYGEPNYNITRLGNDIQSILLNTFTPLDDGGKSRYEQLLTERSKAAIVSLPALSLHWERLCSETEDLLSREIGTSDKITELLRDMTLNEWVKRGCELHKETRSNCAFCGGTVSDERWTVLYKHFDDESRVLEENIDSLLKQIEQEKISVQEGFAVDPSLFYPDFKKQVEQLSQSYLKVAIHYTEQLNAIIEQLTRRKNAITVSLIFERPEDCSQEFSKIWTSYEEMRSQSNEFSNNLLSEQTTARRALLMQEVYEFCGAIGYSEILANIEESKEKLEVAEVAVKNKKAEINGIELTIQDKKRQLNDEEKGALRVNKYLSDFFGHEFLSLQAIKDSENGEKKVRFEIVRDGKRAYHLSEGECSLIAFCYFMAKLDDIETKGTNPIIWIDDPISSLDGNHIFFVYSLIVAEIAEKGLFEQLFVSTHNLDFLKYLRRLNSYEQQANGKLKNRGKQYFMINRNGHYSTVLPMPKYLKEFGTEFNYLFSCVYKCSCITTVDDTNYELFYNFGNNARKFMEIYLYYKYPDYSEDKLQRFFGEENVPPILIERVNNEYSHLSGSIERATMPVEVPEMVSVAKLIINKIKEDSDQYAAFMNSIGITI